MNDMLTRLAELLSGHTESEDTMSLKQFLERLVEIARLEENWDAAGAGKMSPSVVGDALVAAMTLSNEHSIPLPCGVVPIQDGGISMRWVKGETEIIAEFDSDGEITISDSDYEKQEFLMIRKDKP